MSVRLWKFREPRVDKTSRELFLASTVTKAMVDALDSELTYALNYLMEQALGSTDPAVVGLATRAKMLMSTRDYFQGKVSDED